MSAPDLLAGRLRLQTSGCPVCGSLDTETVVEARGLPAHVGVLWRDRDAARSCERGDLHLVACLRCGHLFNAAFDPTALDYGQDYDNSLHASAVFRSFEDDLVRLLARSGPNHGGLVVEIGPGDGRFLRRLCEQRGAPGLGFEPGLGATTIVHDDQVEIRGAPFRSDAVDDAVALVCCRQVLEHIDEPRDLLDEVRTVLARSPEGRAYFEVPNSRRFLHDLAIWDLVYEHCQYFVAESLRHLFELAGFDVLDAWTGYDHQFLCIEVGARDRAGQPQPPDVRAELEPELRSDVRRFADRFAEKSAWWQAELDRRQRAGQRTVLWGGGARAVSFVNLVAQGAGIDFAVDINPAKQGTFLAGTGHAIRPPDALRLDPPDAVVVLNPIYLGEIRAHLASLGLDPEVLPA